MENLDKYIEMAQDMAVQYAPRLFSALLVLILGLWLIKFMVKVVNRGLAHKAIDPILGVFLGSLVSWTLKIILFVVVGSMLGIATTSFVALLGAGGLAIGLALQGSLSNFAGGVLILLFKPFKVGERIETMGRTGEVSEIGIFHTTIVTLDKRTIILPNGPIMNADIVNYMKKGILRVDLIIGISYKSDIQKARNVLLDVMHNHPKVLKDPEPVVLVTELADSSVNLGVRPHCLPEDYAAVYVEVLEAGKLALDRGGITIPFPQVDVHLDKLAIDN
ncbi:MAG: mechanosensitive ion channel protein [Cyclobacteriaceae bacterium]|nr:MAG: mechanosensitive ion channel protein [Cyclobacteriaceae bacterium]